MMNRGDINEVCKYTQGRQLNRDKQGGAGLYYPAVCPLVWVSRWRETASLSHGSGCPSIPDYTCDQETVK